MIPPHELKDLQVHEVSRLKDAGDDATLLSIAERLFYEVAHCRDIKAALDTEDLRPDEYRNEALVCALWISSIVKGEPPGSPTRLQTLNKRHNHCLFWCRGYRIYVFPVPGVLGSLDRQSSTAALHQCRGGSRHHRRRYGQEGSQRSSAQVCARSG